MKLKKQVSKSEQIDPRQSIIIDYDQPLTTMEEYRSLFSEVFGNCEVIKYKKNCSAYLVKSGNKGEIFLSGSITYLSKPHKIFKKRFQLKKWYKKFYEDYKENCNINIRLIGVYHYSGMYVFVDFKIDDYINNKMNSSAAHVYSNDIYQAIMYGKFERVDIKNNHITVVPKVYFKDYIFNRKEDNSLFELFRKFNSGFDFGEWIIAIDAIQEMKNKNFYSWKQTEWAGWLLEYKLQKFLSENNYDRDAKFIADKKTNEYLDFDVYFIKENFYGDLKASDIKKFEAPGNDQRAVCEAINQNQKLWYIIYEHETIKDRDRNNEQAIKRMELIGEIYTGEGKISYADRMKNSVNFKKMQILELNRVNMNQILSDFNQGKQKNGDSRNKKFKINKRDIENYLVFSYTPNFES